MELEFDKEIDSLLRKTDRGVLVGDRPDGKPKVHLDADELAAFAENALPQKTRALHMSHLADCDRCRRILSGLITLNAEAGPVEERIAAPAIVPSVPIEPWYRRFLLPNLAYVMGGLVLIFGGLITFSLLQSADREEAIVSQTIANTSPASGPMEVANELQSLEMTNSNAASNADRPLMNSNATANAAASNSAPSGSAVGHRTDGDAGPADDKNAVTVDGLDARPSAAAPAPMPPPRVKDEAKEVETAAIPQVAREDDRARSEAKKKKTAEGEKADVSVAARQTQDLPRTQAGGVAKSTPGPSRDLSQNFPNRANNTFDMYEQKRVGDKNFQRRDNVWYDLAYSGQATTKIRRQTDEYRKLDKGLRTIAESLNGIVVVMWKDKAYRIQ